MQFYMPTQNPTDWQTGLAASDKHWKVGFSAYALAHAWEQAQTVPQTVQAAFSRTIFADCEPILGLPEHKVTMPGVGFPSQNDLFVLAKAQDDELVSIAVEGKVSESFGTRLSTWYSDSTNKQMRLEGILELIGLPFDNSLLMPIRYQLLHRTASAVVEAQRFNAKYAIMLVHSFSQSDEHFADYQAFVNLYGVAEIAVGQVVRLTNTQNIDLYTVWIRGNERYLREQ